MTNNSSITLREALKGIVDFCPIEIMFNDRLLCDADVDELWVDKELKEHLDDYVVTSLKIDIAHFHHSYVKIQGYKKEGE